MKTMKSTSLIAILLLSIALLGCGEKSNSNRNSASEKIGNEEVSNNSAVKTVRVDQEEITEMPLRERYGYYLKQWIPSLGDNPEDNLQSNPFAQRNTLLLLMMIRDHFGDRFNEEVTIMYGSLRGRESAKKGKLPDFAAEMIDYVKQQKLVIRGIRVSGDEFAEKAFNEKVHNAVLSFPMPEYGTLFVDYGVCVLQEYDFENQILPFSAMIDEFSSWRDFVNKSWNHPIHSNVLIPIFIGQSMLYEIKEADNVVIHSIDNIKVLGLKLPPDQAKTLIEKSIENDPEKQYRYVFSRMVYSIQPPERSGHSPFGKIHSFELYEDAEMQKRIAGFRVEDYREIPITGKPSAEFRY
ncbi:hypothetical protein GF420_03490 [candidate division GN15 bacterium]|nr:hypothetical protein [candidate division GN15 bacterium]